MKIPSKLYYLYSLFTNLNGKTKISPRYKRKIHRKIMKIDFSKFSSFTNEYRVSTRKFLSDNFLGYNDISWHKFYASNNGNFAMNYIPVDLFMNYIEPLLNERTLSRAMGDKAYLDYIFPKDNIIPILGKIIRNRYFDSNNIQVTKTKFIEHISSLDCKLVAKKSVKSSGGKDVYFLDSSEASSFISKMGAKDFYIFQKYFIQSDQLSKFHPSSLNTLRMTTLRVNQKIVILATILRLGTNNSLVDNIAQKGIYCGVSETGELNNNAFDHHHNKYFNHPTTKVEFKNNIIKGFSKCCELAMNSHKQIQNFDIISWDITQDKELNPKIVEINLTRQGIDAHQITNGPLFGKYTEDVLSILKERRDK